MTQAADLVKQFQKRLKPSAEHNNYQLNPTVHQFLPHNGLLSQPKRIKEIKDLASKLSNSNGQQRLGIPTYNKGYLATQTCVDYNHHPSTSRLAEQPSTSTVELLIESYDKFLEMQRQQFHQFLKTVMDVSNNSTICIPSHDPKAISSRPMNDGNEHWKVSAGKIVQVTNNVSDKDSDLDSQKSEESNFQITERVQTKQVDRHKSAEAFVDDSDLLRPLRRSLSGRSVDSWVEDEIEEADPKQLSLKGKKNCTLDVKTKESVISHLNDIFGKKKKCNSIPVKRSSNSLHSISSAPVQTRSGRSVSTPKDFWIPRANGSSSSARSSDDNLRESERKGRKKSSKELSEKGRQLKKVKPRLKKTVSDSENMDMQLTSKKSHERKVSRSGSKVSKRRKRLNN